MRVLVTGGAGFIGSHVVEAFLEAGHEVAVLDNLQVGRRENVPQAARLFKVDLRDAAGVEEVVRETRPALISHQAALANVRESFLDPAGYIETNVTGTIHLLEAARLHGVERLIFASTGGAIYGDAERHPTDESAPARPLDPYGTSKLTAEHLVGIYAQRYGIASCTLRYPNVYGPRQDPYGEGGVIAIFAERMLRDAPTTINGDGAQTRDFLYVGDIAHANLLAAEGAGGLFNLGSGRGTSINHLFDEMAALSGYRRPRQHGPARSGEVRHSALDAGRAEAGLGWRPRVSLRDGLELTLDFFRSRIPR